MTEYSDSTVELHTIIIKEIAKDYLKFLSVEFASSLSYSLFVNTTAILIRFTNALSVTVETGNFDKFTIPLMRKAYPRLVANNICSVQPMTSNNLIDNLQYFNSNVAKTSDNRDTVLMKYLIVISGNYQQQFMLADPEFIANVQNSIKSLVNQ